MSFDESEEHFYRGHLKMVRPQIHHGNFKFLQLALNVSASMIAGIINHNYCVVSPILVDKIQMLANFHDES